MTGKFWIPTHSGRKFSLLDPQPEDVCFEDIVHSLSTQTRFNGHCEPFYSVAEHSIRGSHVVHEKLAGEFFGHDFGETITGDLVTDVKQLINELTKGEWKKIEDRICKVFADVYGLSWPVPEDVEHADHVMAATEIRDLFPYISNLRKLPAPLSETIKPLGLSSLPWEFRRRYRLLRDEGLIK